eukprot:SAG22_NODE_1623_length_3962_cov_20.394253_7_plen_149_part_00
MRSTFIGMDAQFGGNPSWVVTNSGETPTGQVCDADGTNCVEDLCTVVDCGVGGSCTSLAGTCECQIEHGGYSGERCEIHTCCGSTSRQQRNPPYGSGGFCDGGPVVFFCYCAEEESGRGNMNAACSWCDMGWCDQNRPGWDAQCDRAC